MFFFVETQIMHVSVFIGVGQQRRYWWWLLGRKAASSCRRPISCTLFLKTSRTPNSNRKTAFYTDSLPRIPPRVLFTSNNNKKTTVPSRGFSGLLRLPTPTRPYVPRYVIRVSTPKETIFTSFFFLENIRVLIII